MKLSPPSKQAPFCLAALCLLFAGASTRVCAQLSSARSLLESEFSRSGEALGASPLLARRFASRTAQTEGWLAAGIFTEQTARVSRDGKPVLDIHGQGRRLSLTQRLAQRLRLSASFEEGSQSGLVVDNRTGISRSFQTIRDYAVRITGDAGRLEWHAGIAGTRSSGVIRSDLLDRFLPVFTGSPAAELRLSGADAVIGLVLHPGRGIELEALAARRTLPGSLTLEETPTRLTAGFGRSGWLHGGAILAQLPAGFTACLYGARFAASQENLVAREYGAIGRNETRSAEDSWGVGLRRKLPASQQLTVSIAGGASDFDSHAFGLDPAGAGIDGVDKVGYFARSRITRREYRLALDREYSPRRALRLEYRWLEIPIRGEAGYTATLFLIGITRTERLDASDARGHVLRAEYLLPAGRGAIALDVMQVIPMRIRSSGGGGLSTSGGRASGGWSLLATFSYPL